MITRRTPEQQNQQMVSESLHYTAMFLYSHVFLLLKGYSFPNTVALCSHMLSLGWSSSSDLLDFYRYLLILVANLTGMKYFTCTLTDSFCIPGAAEEDSVTEP